MGILLIIIAALSFFSSDIRDWCSPNETRFGQLAWGQKQFRAPSLANCFGISQ